MLFAAITLPLRLMPLRYREATGRPRHVTRRTTRRIRLDSYADIRYMRHACRFSLRALIFAAMLPRHVDITLFTPPPKIFRYFEALSLIYSTWQANVTSARSASP